jgi:hypothetical protein
MGRGDRRIIDGSFRDEDGCGQVRASRREKKKQAGPNVLQHTVLILKRCYYNVGRVSVTTKKNDRQKGNKIE